MSPNGVVRAALVVTVFHLVAAGLALFDSSVANTVSAGINLSLFLSGIVVFVIAFLRAAGRSRTEEVWFGGAFFLSGGVAPQRDRLFLLGAVAIQSVVGLVVAIAKPFSVAAFAVLVPLCGLALTAFYGATFGRFSTKASAQ